MLSLRETLTAAFGWNDSVGGIQSGQTILSVRGQTVVSRAQPCDCELADKYRAASEFRNESISSQPISRGWRFALIKRRIQST